MEEMHGAAMAYYANMSNDQQQMVRSFYDSIDTNGDGKVSVEEYLNFLAEKGYNQCALLNFLAEKGYNQCVPSNLFKLLDRNNDGTLDFEECVTFIYMITGNRLVGCEGCGSYMWGLYFLCVECYNVSKEKTYNLCCSCYRDKNFTHAHSSFLDNYALLRTDQTKKKGKRYLLGAALKIAGLGHLAYVAGDVASQTCTIM